MGTLHANFGNEPLSPLPFTCRMIANAEQADVEIVAAPEQPKDGKYEVLYPVALPGEGAFDWLDLFLSKNTELSDRASAQASLDKPDMRFGVPTIEDKTI